MLHLAILVAACALVAQVSGNNLPACTGALISSRIVSRRTGIGIAVVGYVLGFALEGGGMRVAVARLMPGSTDALVLTALAAAIVIFIVAHVRRVPQSLSQAFACVILGISAARHVGVDRLFVLTMLLFWVFAPVASIVLIVFLMRFSRAVVNERHVWATTRKIKALLLVLSFLAAFTLGANTIGLVYAAIPSDPRTWLLVVLAIVVGSTWFSAGELRRVGNEIVAMRYINSIVAQFSSIALIELATLLAIPLSYTVVFTSGVYGAGFSYKHRLLAAKSAKAIGYLWLAMLVFGFLLGYAAATALGRRAGS